MEKKMLTDEQIFDIIDGCANQELLLKHTYLLENSSEYKSYFEELKSLHLELSSMKIETPSAQFTENILSNLSFEFEKVAVPVFKRKSWSNQLIYIFIGIMASILTVATIYIFSDFEPSTSATEIPRLVMFNNWLATLTFFLKNDFMKMAIAVNLMILLLIFDKKVLKPYFINRKITLS